MNGMNWRDFVDSLHEVEEYQRKVQSRHAKDRDKYTQTGPQRKGGAPFDEDPPKTRSKSAPPGFGGSLEEEVEPERQDEPMPRHRKRLSGSLPEVDEKMGGG